MQGEMAACSEGEDGSIQAEEMALGTMAGCRETMARHRETTARRLGDEGRGDGSEMQEGMMVRVGIYSGILFCYYLILEFCYVVTYLHKLSYSIYPSDHTQMVAPPQRVSTLIDLTDIIRKIP